MALALAVRGDGDDGNQLLGTRGHGAGADHGVPYRSYESN